LAKLVKVTTDDGPEGCINLDNVTKIVDGSDEGDLTTVYFIDGGELIIKEKAAFLAERAQLAHGTSQ